MASRVLLPRPFPSDPTLTIPPVPQLSNVTYPLYPVHPPVQDPAIADKNHRKVLRNRMNAQLSREKKRKYVEDLEERVRVLEVKNKHLERKVVQLESQLAVAHQHGFPLVPVATEHCPATPTADPTLSSSLVNSLPTDFDPSSNVLNFLAELSDDTTMEVSSASSSSSSPSLTSASEIEVEVDLPEFNLVENNDEPHLMLPAEPAPAQSVAAPAQSVAAQQQEYPVWTAFPDHPDNTSSLMDSDDSSPLLHRSDSDADSLDYLFSSSDDEQQPPAQQLGQDAQLQPDQPAQEPQALPLLQSQQGIGDEGEVVLDQGQAPPLVPPGHQQQQQALGIGSDGGVGDGDGAWALQQQASDTSPGGSNQFQDQGPPQLQPQAQAQAQAQAPGGNGQAFSSGGLDQSQQPHGSGDPQRDHLTTPLISSLQNLAGLTEHLAPSLQQLAGLDDPLALAQQQTSFSRSESQRVDVQRGGRDLQPLSQTGERDDQRGESDFQAGDAGTIAQTTRELVDHVNDLTQVTQRFILPIEKYRQEPERGFLAFDAGTGESGDFSPVSALGRLQSPFEVRQQTDQALIISFQRARDALFHFRLMAQIESPRLQPELSGPCNDDVAVQRFQRRFQDQNLLIDLPRETKKEQIRMLVLGFHSQLSQLLHFVLKMSSMAGLSLPAMCHGEPLCGTSQLLSPSLMPSSPSLLVF